MQQRMKMYSAIDVPIIVTVCRCASALLAECLKVRLARRGKYRNRGEELHTHIIRFLELSSSTEVHRIHMLKKIVGGEGP